MCKTMTIKDLKPGYVVELQLHKFAILMNYFNLITNKSELILIDNDSRWIYIKNYNNYLQHIENTAYNIINVYGFPKNPDKVFEISPAQRDLLWTNIDTHTNNLNIKEMTLENIETLLGYKIKLISSTKNE